MKYFLFFAGVLTLTTFSCAGITNDIKPCSFQCANYAYTDYRVFEFFDRYLQQIEKDIIDKKPFSVDEGKFIYLLSYMSGIGTDIESYSGMPILNLRKLRKLKKWYQSYKKKIEWHSIEEGLRLLNKPEMTDEDINKMKLLLIK